MFPYKEVKIKVIVPTVRKVLRSVFTTGVIVSALVIGAAIAPGGPAKAWAANAWTLSQIGDIVQHIDSFWLYWNDKIMVEIRDKLDHTKNIQLVEMNDQVKAARENGWKAYIQADAATVNAKKAEENSWTALLNAKSAAEVIGANVVPDLRDLKARQLSAMEEIKFARENGWKSYIQADAATVQAANNFKEIRGQALTLMKTSQDNFKSVLNAIDALDKKPGTGGSVPANPDRWAEMLMWMSGVAKAVEASAGDACNSLPLPDDPPWISIQASAATAGCKASSRDLRELAKSHRQSADDQTSKIIGAYRELMKGDKENADRQIESAREGFQKVAGQFGELLHKYDKVLDSGPVIQVPTPSFPTITEWEVSLSCIAPSIDSGTDCAGGPTLDIAGAQWQPLNFCNLPDQYSLVKSLIGAILVIFACWAAFRAVIGGFNYSRSE